MVALLGYITADLLVRALPACAADGLARRLGRLAFLLRVPARRRLERNLLALHGRAEPDRGRAAFEHFALAVADFLRLGHVDPPAMTGRVTVRGAEHLEEALHSGGGVILLSAHAGSWEWGAAWLASRGVPLHVVARPHASPAVERFFRRRREAWGIRHLDDRPLWVGASRALREGGWVALMGDRTPPGHRGSLCAWAAALARRTGATILPATMARLADGRHRMWCDEPISPSACGEGAYRAVMLRHLRDCPEQWSAFEPLPEGM